jgi:hypothetical protein
MCNLIVIPWFINVIVRTLWLICSILVELVPSQLFSFNRSRSSYNLLVSNIAYLD